MLSFGADSFDRLFNLSLPDKITEASTNDTAQAESAADDEVKTDANPIDTQIKKQIGKRVHTYYRVVEWKLAFAEINSTETTSAFSTTGGEFV